MGAPAAPSSVTATRVSDTQITVTWTRNATSGDPYSSQHIYVSIDNGSFVEVQAVASTATSFTYTSVASRKYIFRVQARNSAGTATSTSSNTIITTPGAPYSIYAQSISSGRVDGTLKLIGVSGFTEWLLRIEASTNGGVSWSAKTTVTGSTIQGAASQTLRPGGIEYTYAWSDTSAPTSGSVIYRFRTETTGGTQGTLSSAWRSSDTLDLNVPPGAPTNLTPTGIVDVNSPITLAWQHTPSTDGASQSSRQIQYSTDGGSTQTNIVTGNTTAQTYAWSPTLGSFTAGQTILWRVRTAGSVAGTYGAWSEWQSITLRSSLTVAITAPSAGSFAGGPVDVTWTTTPPWSSATQALYRVVLTQAGAVVWDSDQVASTTPAATIPANVILNSTSYVINVTVTDNYGLVSATATRSITTSFTKPAAVDLAWLYDDSVGILTLTPTFNSGATATVSWMLERSIDGSTWETIGTYGSASAIPDPTARIGAVSYYRTTGYSNLGAAGDPTVHTVPAADVVSKWGWLTYQGTSVRFGWSQTVEISAGRASEVYDIEGVDYPAAVFGRAKSRIFTVNGKLLYKASAGADGIADDKVTSTAEEMINFAETAGVCVFRDAEGSWWTARMSGLKVSPRRAIEGQPDESTVGFQIERVTA